MSQLAFYFDSNSCSGCKTCVIACKDKNNLAIGIRWRRVYEIAGGNWEKKGNAWINNITAYNISMACNHCAEPVCLQACPTKAITKRADGIVEINQKICMGCRYCEWVCPYSSPQFDEQNGVMTKCNLCADYVDEGKKPSCVDACLMRVLDFGTFDELTEKYGKSDNIHPLPEQHYTHPSLIMNTHKQIVDKMDIQFEVVNTEEVKNAK